MLQTPVYVLRHFWRWQQKSTRSGEFVPGDEGGQNCATDGDVDIATALFLAARVWGRGGQQGELDYKSAAIELAGCVWQHCVNHETYMPLIGDWADPGDDAYRLTRPSDFILSGFLVFYQDDTQRSNQWANVINAIINCTNGQLALNPQTGLIGDFLQNNGQGQYYPARGEVLESDKDGDYNWNSCRVPWRLGHYYMLTRDERLRQVLETQAQFFAGQLAARGSSGGGDSAIRAGYHLNGRPFADYTDMAFVAPVSFLFWVLGWQNQLQQTLQDMNGLEEKTYFGESIAMLCVLMAAVPYWSSWQFISTFLFPFPLHIYAFLTQTSGISSWQINNK